jgi:hypothetical protein
MCRPHIEALRDILPSARFWEKGLPTYIKTGLSSMWPLCLSSSAPCRSSWTNDTRAGSKDRAGCVRR